MDRTQVIKTTPWWIIKDAGQKPLYADQGRAIKWTSQTSPIKVHRERFTIIVAIQVVLHADNGYFILLHPLLLFITPSLTLLVQSMPFNHMWYVRTGDEFQGHVN